MELQRRHGETHYANIAYGYYAGIVSIAFVALLIAGRKLGSFRPQGRSKWSKAVLRGVHSGSPLIYLVVLYVALLTPFIHHYSLVGHVSVYLKRLGRLSYVLAALNLFITLRPNPILRGYAYVDLIPLHKWLSRSIFVLSSIHGIGFLIKWGLDPQVSIVAKAVRKPYNFVGVIISTLLAFLIVLSLKPMRRFSYRTFYLMHTIASWAFIFLTAVHARPGVFVPYTLINLGLVTLHLITRTAFARQVELLPKSSGDTGLGLSKIKLPRSAMPDTFYPGCHLRISLYRRINPLYYLLPSHPYTVASLSEDKNVELIVREHATGFRLLTGLQYTILNHYDSFPRSALQDATRVALVCGGSGISYALPIFRYFASNAITGQIKYLKLIWLVRDSSDLSVLQDMSTLAFKTAQFEVFVTRSVPQDDTAIEDPLRGSIRHGENSGHDDLEFELESLGDQLDHNGALINPKTDIIPEGIASSVHFGRKLA